MKIKTKLLIGLSALPILIILLIGVVWLQLDNMDEMNASTQNGYDLSLLAGEIHIGVKNEAITMRNLVVFNDHESVDQELSRLQVESDEVTRKIAELASKVESSEQKERIKELENANREFNLYKEELVRLVNAGETAAAIELISTKGQIVHDQFFEITSEITSRFETNMRNTIETSVQDFKRNINFSSIIVLLGFLLIIGFVARTIWMIAKRLNKVSTEMSLVAKGKADVSTRLAVYADDEIGEVAASFNTMLKSLEKQMEKEQNLIWSKSNVADVTTSLYGKHDLESLSRTLLSKIAPLTESGHAVIYVKDINQEQGGEPEYKLLASYGYKERKHLSNVFKPGEGLIGQAVLEKAPIILTNAPSDYVQINSGLGEAPPLYLYVMPVLFEDDVKAVIEIASFKTFDQTQQNFIEETVNGLGIILDSVMGRIRLAKLLEESQSLMEEVQAQSEELQSQQEELRVTNEELEEQTQALRQSEERLQVQQEELEQTNAELEEKAERLEEQNNKFELTNREVEKARAELEEKAKQLVISSKYKSEFLANMSHELRTPLNSLLILSKLLADNPNGNLSAKQVEYSKTIYSSGQDLLTLINDILDLTKIESGKMEVVSGKVLIKDLTKFVEQRFRPLANDKELSFKINVKDRVPAFIYSDEQRLKQVMKNLLSNAFKFTHQGEVALEIDYDGRFSFAVTDTGIGIPTEKQELIFEAFQQADGTTSRRYGGTGLGLSICREISALLDGEIEVESVAGNGSRFTFYVDHYQANGHELSLNEVAVAKEELVVKSKEENPLPEFIMPSSPPELNKDIKRLLIVDDDLKQRNSLMELIGDMNVVIKAVSTGREAIEELKVNQLDCLVLDLGLTDTNGFNLLEEIKPYIVNEHLKVFIYTGRDLTSKEEIYLNKYSHTIIIKDEHSPQRLVDELELFLSLNNEQAESPNETKSGVNRGLPELKGRKILLVDDDVRNIYAISSILEQYGMDIAFAENGVESLEILRKDPSFDLVLMDIMMPEMDGYEAIRRIRGNSLFENLPIIALTAKAMKEDRDKCMEAGASDYIVKPVDPDRLISLMAVWLYCQEGK